VTASKKRRGSSAKPLPWYESDRDGGEVPTAEAPVTVGDAGDVDEDVRAFLDFLLTETLRTWPTE
jgi:hypothetical protein